ncbi:CoA pyrophosphatase [Nitrincola alkalisediminis]|nr:CoA pyrophosphatase [Nitrincola alkalisediminis]
MLSDALKQLSTHRPWCLRTSGEEAAILVPLTQDEMNPELILTVRAQHLNSHKGEVCFPGGKRDAIDHCLQTTALREAHEEIGLMPEQVKVQMTLSQVVSKHGLQVTPWVGVIPAQVELVPNPAEIARIFRVPIRYFLECPAPITHRFERNGQEWLVPAWRYEGELIWGLTAHVINELLTVGFNKPSAFPVRPERRLAEKDA